MEIDGRVIQVPPQMNVLAAALAAGMPLPHSCREGRCASCKAQLLHGTIAYPQDLLPPGITALEAARGEVLLCQAQPRGDLTIQSRRVAVQRRESVQCVVTRREILPVGHLRLDLSWTQPLAQLALRPGQYVDLTSGAGGSERACVVAVLEQGIGVESDALERLPQVGQQVAVRGPFDRPR